jgi:hypothetical protein
MQEYIHLEYFELNYKFLLKINFSFLIIKFKYFNDK